MGGVLAVSGLATGLAAAALSGRWLRSVLEGVEPSDPVTFSVVTLLILAVALIASILPALSASRVDPIRVLREE